MGQKLKRYSMIATIAVGFIVLLGGVVFARWSRGSHWDFNVEPDEICPTNITFGFADAREIDDSYEFTFYRDLSGTLEEVGYIELSKNQFPEIPQNPGPDEYCSNFDDPNKGTGDEIRYCGGPFNLDWDLTDLGLQSLAAGTQLRLVIRADGQDLTKAGEDEDYNLGVVDECTPLPDPVVEVIETGSGNTNTFVTDALVFRAKAYDPNVGTSDGDGIQNVDMRILDPDGAQVRQKTESNDPYCVWGGSSPCPIWNFAANDYKWMNGTPIKNGEHTLRATARTPDNRQKMIEQKITIQLQPFTVNLLQTAPSSTGPLVTEALAFQLEAYAGPANDGWGIDRVEMEIRGPANQIVHQRTESNAGYCAFGGDVCTLWNFAANDYRWPNDQPIENGPHTLRATVYTDDGRSKTVNFPIQIQLPLVTNLVQTGPGTTASVISDTLVFQVEAFVGPNNSDGDEIDSVELSILNANNVTVHQQTDTQAKYCAFGGGALNCNPWTFADQANKWPNGQPVQNGSHTLRAVINTSDGRSPTHSYPIQLQLPNAETQEIFLYLPAILK